MTKWGDMMLGRSPLQERLSEGLVQVALEELAVPELAHKLAIDQHRIEAHQDGRRDAGHLQPLIEAVVDAAVVGGGADREGLVRVEDDQVSVAADSDRAF